MDGSAALQLNLSRSAARRTGDIAVSPVRHLVAGWAARGLPGPAAPERSERGDVAGSDDGVGHSVRRERAEPAAAVDGAGTTALPDVKRLRPPPPLSLVVRPMGIGAPEARTPRGDQQSTMKRTQTPGRRAA
jgi:hypothetical protein